MPHPYDAIIPLFLEDCTSGKVVPVGSCVLVDVDGEHFLLTAAHVTDHTSEDRDLLIPGHKHLIPIEGGFAELGKAGNRNHRSSSLDIAYYHLSQNMVARLDPDFHPITPEGFGMLYKAERDDLHTITGYPEDTTAVGEGGCSTEFFALTGVAPDAQYYRKLEYRPDMHILTKFNLRRCAILRGSAENTPAPFCMSGGGVFSWPRSANPLEPNPCPKLVGISIAWHRRYAIFSATRIECFLMCIAKNNPDLIRMIPVEVNS